MVLVWFGLIWSFRHHSRSRRHHCFWWKNWGNCIAAISCSLRKKFDSLFPVSVFIVKQFCICFVRFHANIASPLPLAFGSCIFVIIFKLSFHWIQASLIQEASTWFSCAWHVFVLCVTYYIVYVMYSVFAINIFACT